MISYFHHKNSNRAFTLTEILVTIPMVALLIFGAYRFLATSTKNVSSSQLRTVQMTRIRKALDYIEKDFQNSGNNIQGYVVSNQESKSEDTTFNQTISGHVYYFPFGFRPVPGGSHDLFQMYSSRDSTATFGHTRGDDILYYLKDLDQDGEKNDLVRQLTWIDSGNSKTQETTVLDDIRKIEVEYFDSFNPSTSLGTVVLETSGRTETGTFSVTQDAYEETDLHNRIGSMRFQAEVDIDGKFYRFEQKFQKRIYR